MEPMLRTPRARVVSGSIKLNTCETSSNSFYTVLLSMRLSGIQMFLLDIQTLTDIAIPFSSIMSRYFMETRSNNSIVMISRLL